LYDMLMNNIIFQIYFETDLGASLCLIWFYTKIGEKIGWAEFGALFGAVLWLICFSGSSFLDEFTAQKHDGVKCVSISSIVVELVVVVVLVAHQALIPSNHNLLQKKD
ncbi:hypothetical protein ACJX0J_033725, partial [Zea mays]